MWFQEMSTRQKHFSGPAWCLKATRVLVLVCFLGCEMEWNVPEQTGKGLSLTTFPPKASHKHCIQTNPFRVHSTLLRVLRCYDAALSGRRLELGSSAPGEVEAS